MSFKSAQCSAGNLSHNYVYTTLVNAQTIHKYFRHYNHVDIFVADRESKLNSQINCIRNEQKRLQFQQ